WTSDGVAGKLWKLHCGQKWLQNAQRKFENSGQPLLCYQFLQNKPIKLLATYYYFNLEIPGLEELREQYRQRLNLNPPLQISKERCSDINAEKNRNIFPLNTLLQQNPDGYRAHFQDITERPVSYSFGHLLYTKCRRVNGKQCTIDPLQTGTPVQLPQTSIMAQTLTGKHIALATLIYDGVHDSIVTSFG
ncbi:hypothetical protein Tco_0189194, partial [Tanacetum coccineum]